MSTFRETDGELRLHDTTLILPAAESPIAARVRIQYGAETHVGKVRSSNEDQYLVARAVKSLDILATTVPQKSSAQLLQQEGYFLLVADGLGGHLGGERASALIVNEAVRHIMETAKWFFRLDDPDEDVRLRLLHEALDRADRKLREESERDRTLAGMGTTLTALHILGADAFLVHVGDSRAYLFRDDVLEQLTTDHTLVQQMVQGGLLAPEAVKTHRLRHVVTNVIGGSPGVEGEIVNLRLRDGDRLLLCTDGLTEPVPDEQIAEILRHAPDPQQASHALVEAALNKGGRDNITVVVAACGF
jgi:protein phosphatase